MDWTTWYCIHFIADKLCIIIISVFSTIRKKWTKRAVTPVLRVAKVGRGGHRWAVKLLLLCNAALQTDQSCRGLSGDRSARKLYRTCWQPRMPTRLVILLLLLLLPLLLFCHNASASWWSVDEIHYLSFVFFNSFEHETPIIETRITNFESVISISILRHQRKFVVFTKKIRLVTKNYHRNIVILFFKRKLFNENMIIELENIITLFL